MIELRDGKTLVQNQVVECYRNLHKKAFSIRDKHSKRVVASGNSFVLDDVRIRVSEVARQRVIKEKQKNVHAWLIGSYSGIVDIDTSSMIELYYNPYKHDSFIRLDNKQPVHNMSRVYFKDNKCWIVE